MVHVDVLLPKGSGSASGHTHHLIAGTLANQDGMWCSGSMLRHSLVQNASYVWLLVVEQQVSSEYEPPPMPGMDPTSSLAQPPCLANL